MIGMDRNKIGSTGAKKLAASIKYWGSHPVLNTLSLEDCNIDAAGFVPLMEALASCKRLEYLYISGQSYRWSIWGS